MSLNPKLPNNGLVIHWDMWYRCKLNCPYCFYKGFQNKLRLKEAKVGIADWVKAFANINRPLFIGIDGGEPFLKKNFFKLAMRLQDFAVLGIATSLITNVHQFSKEIDFTRVARMLLSYHPTINQSINEFIEKVYLLKNAGLKTYIINCVAYPSFIHSIPKYFEEFKKAGLKMHVSRFIGEYQGRIFPQEYTFEEIKIFKKYMHNPINDIQLLNKNIPNGMVCEAGMNFIYVGANGDVSRCCHNSNIVIGNILKGEMDLAKDSQSCHVEACYAFQAIERGITPFMSKSEAIKYANKFYSSF